MLKILGGGLMTHAGLTHAYEVALGPAALVAILRLTGERRRQLGEALRHELIAGPNAHMEVRYDSDMRAWRGRSAEAAPDGVIYTATPLSHGGYTAVHRPMDSHELKWWRHEHGHAADKGVYVFDILSATAAFTRSVPPRLP